KREWMQRLASNCSSSRSPCTVSTPPLIFEAGAAAGVAGAAAGRGAAAAAAGAAGVRSKPLPALAASEASCRAAATARASPPAASGAAPSASCLMRSTNTRRAAGPGGSAAESRSVINDMPPLHCGFDGPADSRAARLSAGPSNPQCNGGMSFITLRDSAALPPGPAARRVFVERIKQLAEGAAPLAAGGDARAVAAARQLASLAASAGKGFDLTPAAPAAAAAAPRPAAAPATPAAAPASNISGGVETVQGERLELQFEARRCIHSRFCVTGAPQVFLANVKGPWIHPDAMPVERLVEVAHACPSGAIRYR